MFHLAHGGFEVLVYCVTCSFALVFADVLCKELESYKTAAVTSAATIQVLEAQPQTTAELNVSDNAPLIVQSPLYELRGAIVLKTDTLPQTLIDQVKQFQLRGEPVVKLIDLQRVQPQIAIAAQPVLDKWQQWRESSSPRRTKKRSRIVASVGKVEAIVAG